MKDFTKLSVLVVGLLWFAMSTTTLAQDVPTTAILSSEDSVNLKIVSVVADSFPEVSVVLRAESKSGQPLWDLTAEHFLVKENGQSQEIVSVEPLSRAMPIHVSIVVDHSGSMSVDKAQLFSKTGRPLYSLNFFTGEVTYPKGYTTPIESAKRAIKKFSSEFNFKKDFVGIVGFSSRVDKILPLCQSQAKIDSIMDSMEADSLTALYDAMFEGLNLLHTKGAVNVVIVLTDGQNNKSRLSWKDVVDRAIAIQTPLYIVSLGSVNQDTLKNMAAATSGQFYYTRRSDSLDSIYSIISKKVQALYELHYLSNQLQPDDSSRNVSVEMAYNNQRLSVVHKITLPKHVIENLVERETQGSYIKIGGGIVCVSFGATIFFWLWNRRRKKENYTA